MQSCKLLALLPLSLISLLLVHLVHVSLHFIREILLQLSILLYKSRTIALVSSSLNTLLELALILRPDTLLEVLFRIESGGKGALVHPQVVASRLYCIMVFTIACCVIGAVKYVCCILQIEINGLIKYSSLTIVT